jgi:hypothetical protein
MAKVVPEKTRRTRRLDGRNKDFAQLTQKDDAKLPLRDSGSMWQGDFSEIWREFRREISSYEFSTTPTEYPRKI